MIEDILKKLPKPFQIEIIENLQKNLTQSEIYKAQKKIQKILRKDSQQGKRTDLETSSKNLEKVSHGTVETIAKIFHESHEMVRQRQYVFERIEKNPKKFEDLKKRLDSGKTKISYAFDMLQREEDKKKPTPPLPPGVYSLAYIDFPWDYFQKLAGSARYGGLTLEEIKKKFPTLPLADNAIVLMWVTNPKLMEALELFKFYGIEYKTNVVWVKMKKGKLKITTGWYVRGAHELLLIGVKGTPGVPFESDRIPSVVFAEPKGHSAKPFVFIKIIQQLFPRTKKLEMFARGPKDRVYDSTWTRWGKQVED